MTVTHLQSGAVYDRISLHFSFTLSQDGNFAVSVHGHEITFVILDRFKINELYLTLVSGLDSSLLNTSTYCTTDMKCPHGQLCSRLSNRLGGNNPDGLPEIYFMPVSQISAITCPAYTSFRFACQNRPYPYPLYTGGLYLLNLIFTYRPVGPNQHFSCYGIIDIFKSQPAKYPRAHSLKNLAPLHKGLNPNAIHSTAIFLSNNCLLRYIHESAGKITRVGCLEGGVSQTLSCSMSRYKVLQNSQAFPEI